MSIEMIDRLLSELTPQWECDQQDVDLTRRLARLWEDRFNQKRDLESLEGAFYYYHHLQELLGGTEPEITRKLAALSLQRIKLRIKSIENWFAQGGNMHEEAASYRKELENLKMEMAYVSSKIKPTAPMINPFLSPPKDRDAPPFPGPDTFGAN